MTNWSDMLTETGALWQHSGDSRMPHALLASGRHSNAYSNGSKIITDPTLLTKVVGAMRDAIADEIKTHTPTIVVGPAMGAVAIGYEMARQLGVRFVFTEPKETPEGKMQVLKRFDIPKGATVLMVEDMVTTGGSIKKTIDTIEAVGPTVMPVIPIILDRSNGAALEIGAGRRIVPLVMLSVDSWEPSACPLCKEGSEVLAPKANWDKFVS